MNDSCILIVEDDTSVRNLITTTLKSNDYKYITAQNGENAISSAASHNPEIILLDLGLPDMDGIDVIRKIRSWSSVPIIVISARSEDSDKIEALDMGADDYLTKPFSVEELLARLRAIKRRLAMLKSDNSNEESVYVNGELVIDYMAATVSVCGNPVNLTPIEYKLLCLLAKNSGRVLTRTYITKEIWGSSFESDLSSLKVFMSTLRKKLEKNGDGRTQYIQTHIGIGYRMVNIVK